jgi:hypothetical protein
MASTIVTKNSSTASAVPVTGDLTQGELAVNVTDKKLYTKDSGGTVVKLVGGLGNQEANAVAITGGSINGTTVGATTASTGAFTTLSASSTVSGTGFSTYLASPPAIGGTAAAAGSFTTLSASSTTTLSGGTANGVAYLNGSKVVTTGSALTFDGTNNVSLGSAGSSNAATSLTLNATDNSANGSYILGKRNGSNAWLIGDTASSLGSGSGFTSYNYGTAPWIWYLQTGGEQMRLTSTGLGIGTSSPSQKLHIAGNTFRHNDATGSYGYTISAATNTTTLATLFGGSSFAIQTGASGTNQFLLDASGNLGVGTTSPSGRITVSTNGSGGVNVNESTNATATYGYLTVSHYTNGAFISTVAGSNAGANILRFGTGSTERMRLDTSGNVGIGTSSPVDKLEVYSIITARASSGTSALRLRNTTTDMQWQSVAGTNAVSLFDNGVGATRLTVDSSGNLLVGTTAQQTGGNGKLSVSGGSSTAATLTNNSNASAYTAEVFNYTTGTGAGVGRYFKFAMGSTPTQTGSIIGDGTNTAYNTSSDYRLKENITPMTGALALVMQQRPVTWTWKLNGNQGKGFIAHWLQEDGAGECVTGHKDAVDENGNPEYQGVDTSFLVATLTAAIQELKAEFDAYKATHP